ncbi:MAG TPA: tripartite tricarboxylate transporter substrate binding protein [Burkholderiales bacterium]|nr:tripartite tricarboxylate transporter substrate binding protein [Burkholderiales bacterium]
MRTVLSFLVLLLALPAHAQFPAKPIRVVVPFGAGSSTDIVMRIIAQPLGQALGQTVVVENKPGADGAIAAVEVAKAPADGHTLILGTNSPFSATPHLRKSLPYDALNDFTPISLVGYYTFFVLVHPGVPAKTLPELISHVRANPGKLNYATGNTSGIVMTAMLASQAGMNVVHIPYKSEPPAITDLLSGQIHMMISSYATVAPHMREGRLRPLVTTLPSRSPLMPEVPTIVEAGFPKFSVSPWAGMFGPARMPREVTERINRELNALLNRPDVRESLAKQAFDPKGLGADEFNTFVREQFDIWGKAIRDAGIKAE